MPPGSTFVTHSALFFRVTSALKYTKVEQLSLRERLARINTHTLSKKTTRLSQLLKQEAGLVPRVSLCSGGGDTAMKTGGGGGTFRNLGS